MTAAQETTTNEVMDMLTKIYARLDETNKKYDQKLTQPYQKKEIIYPTTSNFTNGQEQTDGSMPKQEKRVTYQAALYANPTTSNFPNGHFSTTETKYINEQPIFDNHQTAFENIPNLAYELPFPQNALTSKLTTLQNKQIELPQMSQPFKKILETITRVQQNLNAQNKSLNNMMQVIGDSINKMSEEAQEKILSKKVNKAVESLKKQVLTETLQLKRQVKHQSPEFKEQISRKIQEKLAKFREQLKQAVL